MIKYKPNTSPPVFTRGEVADILQVSTMTIYNREKRGIYPKPSRDLNGYRVYSVEDVLLLQVISRSKIEPKLIASKLHDKGYYDTKIVENILDSAIKKITK